MSDLANPGFGSQTAAWPAALLILSLAITQAGSRGIIAPELSIYSGTVLFLLGLIGTVITGLAFFSNVIGRSDIPAQAITASWFVPVVPLVLVPSIMVRFTQLVPEFDKSTAAVIGVIGWGIGFGLFLLLAAVIGGRLLTHEPPPPHAVASWWAWLAPIGAGSLGIAALSVLYENAFGWSTLSELSSFVMSAMWGFSLWWAIFAGLIVIRQLPKTSFHVGLWGFGFPTAALISLTLEVGRRLDVAWIGILGSLLWTLLLLAILLLTFKTIQGLRSGKIWQR
jgi:tellurite resistance protein TehA-like permease